MPTTEDGKKTGSAARAELDPNGDSFVSKDTFDNPSIKALANTATVTDGYGIERIVGVGGGSDFTPAPTEATPEQKAHMEGFQKTLADAKDERTALLGGGAKDAEEGAQNAVQASDVDEADRAVNHPGIGGSQAIGDPAKNDSSTEKGGKPETEGDGSQQKSQNDSDKTPSQTPAPQNQKGGK